MENNLLNQKLLSNLILNYDRNILFFPDSGKYFNGRELLIRISQLMEEFSKEDIELVVLDLNNSEDFVVSFLASLFLGLDILIINPNDSIQKKNNIIKLFNLKNKLIFNFVKEWKGGDEHIDLNEDKKSKIYIPTSSTTGDSKIVPHSIDMILSNIESIVEHHKLTNSKTISTSLPLYHVNALYFTFLASFFAGGRVVIHQVTNVKKIIECIPAYDVDIISMIPTIIESIIRNIEILEIKNFDRLSYVVSAAAPLSKKAALQFYHLTKKRILQGYGLSEAVNFSCTIPIDIIQSDYEILINDQPIPTIGIALPCNQIEIVKKNGDICSDGEIGEIVISGKNVFNGYFPTDPMCKSSPKLNTGDLGYWSSYKGIRYYYISSRLKEVAKINGESVSLRELDDAYGSLDVGDMYTVSFENDYQGEAIALVCSNEVKGECLDHLIEKIKLKSDKLPYLFRARALLQVELETMRTASGKAKRWSWSSQFQQLQKIRLGSKLILIKKD